MFYIYGRWYSVYYDGNGMAFGSCCSLHTHLTLARGGPIFLLVVHQPASPSIWPAVQSHRRGLSTNPGVTCKVGAYVGAVEEMMCMGVTDGT